MTGPKTSLQSSEKVPWVWFLRLEEKYEIEKGSRILNTGDKVTKGFALTLVFCHSNLVDHFLCFKGIISIHVEKGMIVRYRELWYLGCF